MIKLDLSYAELASDLASYQPAVMAAQAALMNKTGLGNDYLGWLDWPINYDQAEFDQIIALGNEIKQNANTLVVCGIGGSYLGARAVIDMVQGLYPERDVEIIYVGNSFSAPHLMQILKYLTTRNVYVNVISKSGKTLETALSFRYLKHFMEDKYGADSQKRIIVTTDPQAGLLKKMADKNGYRTLTIPADIGGRFSVNTAVGLLPLQAAGIDIQAFMTGFKNGYERYRSADLNENPAYQYAVARRILEKQGKGVELLVTYEPALVIFAEWWKQLFGESEGKAEKGIFPASVNFSTDLHSMGQFIQEGTKLLFETIIQVETPMSDDTIFSVKDDLDELNYLAGKTLQEINQSAALGTLAAHHEAGINCLVLTIKDTSASSVGELMYFFFQAIALSVYLLKENPFDQPGVEVYKAKMQNLLKK